MVVIRWTVNLLVVAGLAMVMKQATDMHRVDTRADSWKPGILRALAYRP
ncbi:MAG TPA: hypothetical protein PKO15_08115 [Fibrobacteria bacterium]|nr:hypothetical protein [Fibrobacteria bacterium]HOX53017.1 hypothetical protein [Fibrobacteria bacterium]